MVSGKLTKIPFEIEDLCRFNFLSAGWSWAGWSLYLYAYIPTVQVLRMAFGGHASTRGKENPEIRKYYVTLVDYEVRRLNVQLVRIAKGLVEIKFTRIPMICVRSQRYL
jgi:hypothetical protein